jgi:IMP dehydrogenase
MGLPIIAANMDTVTGYDMAAAMAELDGYGILHRVKDSEIDKQASTVRCLADLGVNPAVAIGVHGWATASLETLLNAGAGILCLDVAHADNILVYRRLQDMTGRWEKQKPFELIVGNIATYEAAMRLLNKFGTMIDALKVGIGPGSLCSTRIVTGHGVPQITAIMEVKRALDEYNSGRAGQIRLIADGGISKSSDIVKALAFGADSAMIGGLIAGTDETPGIPTTVGETRCKVYRGMASYDAMVDNGREGVTPEGFSALVPCKGTVVPIIKGLRGGVQSGLSYSGAVNIAEFQRVVKYRIVSSATLTENHPHLFQKVNVSIS